MVEHTFKRHMLRMFLGDLQLLIYTHRRPTTVLKGDTVIIPIPISDEEIEALKGQITCSSSPGY